MQSGCVLSNTDLFRSAADLAAASAALRDALGVTLSPAAVSVVKEVSHLVTRRAARLSAAGIVAVLTHMGLQAPPAGGAPTVAVDGGATLRDMLHAEAVLTCPLLCRRPVRAPHCVRSLRARHRGRNGRGRAAAPHARWLRRRRCAAGSSRLPLVSEERREKTHATTMRRCKSHALRFCELCASFMCGRRVVVACMRLRAATHA